MSKQVKLKEAPKYQINSAGEISNIDSGKVVSVNKGSVRLSTEQGRKAFKVEDLKSRYFDTKAIKASKKTKSKLSNGKKLTEKDRDKIRKTYDKDPNNFSMSKTAEKFDISYGRVWGIIKTHQKNLKTKKQ